MEYDPIWIESYHRRINAVNRSLEEAALRGSADGILDIKATAEILRGSIAELKKAIAANKQYKADLEAANAEIVMLKDTIQGA